MIKVRYNLARGKNYMKWKIESKSGVEYHSPDNVQLIMSNCVLKNNKKLAQRIFNGENKNVCAWILCESITINIKGYTEFEQKNEPAYQIKYNPKIAPYWRIDEIKYSIDNNILKRITSFEKDLFLSSPNTFHNG
jgi:hypothetical protein